MYHKVYPNSVIFGLDFEWALVTSPLSALLFYAILVLWCVKVSYPYQIECVFVPTMSTRKPAPDDTKTVLERYVWCAHHKPLFGFFLSLQFDFK